MDSLQIPARGTAVPEPCAEVTPPIRHFPGATAGNQRRALSAGKKISRNLASLPRFKTDFVLVVVCFHPVALKLCSTTDSHERHICLRHRERPLKTLRTTLQQVVVCLDLSDRSSRGHSRRRLAGRLPRHS